MSRVRFDLWDRDKGFEGGRYPELKSLVVSFCTSWSLFNSTDLTLQITFSSCTIKAPALYDASLAHQGKGVKIQSGRASAFYALLFKVRNSHRIAVPLSTHPTAVAFRNPAPPSTLWRACTMHLEEP
jgi:hypothetical protein